MNLTVYPTRDAWLAARTAGIGASEVACILGTSPHRGPWDVWQAKRAGAVDGDPDVVLGDDPDAAPDLNDPRTRGQVWEPFARRLAGLVMAREVQPPAPDDGIAHVTHPGAAWATCSPDGWLADADGVCPLELKTDASRSGFGWAPSGVTVDGLGDGEAPPVPPHYLTQVYWQIEVTGAPRGYLVVLLGSFRVRWYVVNRNDAIQAAMLRKVGAWYERHVVGGFAPNRDDSESNLRLMRELYERREGIRPATADEIDACLRLQAARATAKDADLAARIASLDLLASMTDCTTITAGKARALVDTRRAIRLYGTF